MKKILSLVLFVLLLSCSSVAPMKDSQQSKMKNRYRQYLISQGPLLESLSKEDRESVILKADKSGKASLDKLEKQLKEGCIFEKDTPKNIGVSLRAAFIDVYNVTRAIETKGTSIYNDKNAKQVVISTLEKALNIYKPDALETGNWWNWEIGIPKAINDIFIIETFIPNNIRQKLFISSHYFQPDPNYSGSSSGAKESTNPYKRETTGGNRADTALISLIRGINENNINEIDKSIDAISKLNIEKNVFKPVKNLETASDGFYTDGSFIQHASVAYNGTYGAVMLNGLGLFSYIAKGYEKFDGNKIFNLLYKNILEGYPWLLINGGINDSVNGRSISRDGTNDLTKAREIIQPLVLVAESAPTIYKDKLKQMIKKVIVENKYNNQIDLVTNKVAKILLTEIKNDESIKPLETKGVKLFPFMDRAVYINSNGGKFVIAMHSNRIANYETMNKENLKGWFTGDGMTYIYTDKSNHYVDYYPSLNFYHLPGTTESLRPLKDGEQSLRIDRIEKTFAGGVTDSNIGLVGMDFLRPDKSLEAKKSWVFVDGFMIALGSKISSKDGYEIHTTVDNKILDDFIVNNDGNKITLTSQDSYIEYIPIDSKFNSLTTINTGSWKSIGGKSEQEVSKKYFELYINHGVNPQNKTYAYVVSPMLKNKFNIKDLVIEKLDDIHAIRYKNIQFINFFTPQKFNNIEVFEPLSIALIENTDNVELLVSNPSHYLDEAKVILHGTYTLDDNSVKIEYAKDKTILFVPLNQGYTTKLKLNKVR